MFPGNEKIPTLVIRVWKKWNTSCHYFTKKLGIVRKLNVAATSEFRCTLLNKHDINKSNRIRVINKLRWAEKISSPCLQKMYLVLISRELNIHPVNLIYCNCPSWDGAGSNLHNMLFSYPPQLSAFRSL